MSLSVWLRRGAILSVVGGGSALLMTQFMPNRETAPLRHPSTFNWVNLGCDKIYFHFGRHLRKLVDAETGHVQAIKVAAAPRTIRGILGMIPPQFDYDNLHSEPFNKKQREDDESRSKDGILRTPSDSRLKNLHFDNPLGLAAGFDKNAEVSVRAMICDAMACDVRIRLRLTRR